MLRVFGCMVASRGGYRMARGWHYVKLSLSNAPRLSFSDLCILLFLFLLFVVFCMFVFFFCSHWSLVDVPLIFFCPADHVPDWQPRVLLGMCYESLERLIGISHKHWNHGKINGGQKRHYPFRDPKWRYPYLGGLSTRPYPPSDHSLTLSLTLFFFSRPSNSNLDNR